MYITLLTTLSNIIDNIYIDGTIRISDIISTLSVIITIFIAFTTIHKNNKNVNKQLSQQQQIFKIQIEKSEKNHIENKNVELKINQIEYLPIIDINNVVCECDENKIKFNICLKNIGNGTALKCFLCTGENLIVYKDPNEPELQYIQTEPGIPILNVNDSFETSIVTNRMPKSRIHAVDFSITYDDLMGRKYRQRFVFNYLFPDNKPTITDKYEWECIQDIEFKL